MKRTFLILIISLSSGWLWAQEGVKFEELTFQEALEKAKAENRWIFLDAYTSWCGPCKMMAEKVFTRAEAGGLLQYPFCQREV